jgi:hypothetical protein
VTQDTHSHRGRGAFGGEQRRAGVAQVVEAHIRQASSAQCLFEVSYQVAGTQRRTPYALS